MAVGPYMSHTHWGLGCLPGYMEQLTQAVLDLLSNLSDAKTHHKSSSGSQSISQESSSLPLNWTPAHVFSPSASCCPLHCQFLCLCLPTNAAIATWPTRLCIQVSFNSLVFPVLPHGPPHPLCSNDSVKQPSVPNPPSNALESIAAAFGEKNKNISLKLPTQIKSSLSNNPNL